MDTKSYVNVEKISSDDFSDSIYKTLSLSYSPYFTVLVVGLLLGLIARALLLLTTNIIGMWVDRIECDSAGKGECLGLSLYFENLSNSDFVKLLIVTILIAALFNAIFRVIVARSGVFAVGRLYDEVTTRSSRFPISFYDHNPIGRMVTRFTSDYGSLFRMAGGPMGEFLAQVMDLFLILIGATLASVYFLPLMLFTFGLNWIVYRSNRDSLRQERRKVSRSRAATVAHFAETTQGASTIRIFSKEEEFGQRFDKLILLAARQRIKTVYYFQYCTFLIVSSATCSMLFGCLAGAYLVKYGYVTVGSLGVGISYLMLMSIVTQVFFDYLSNMEEAFTGLERLDEYLRIPLEHGVGLPNSINFRIPSDPNIIPQTANSVLPKNSSLEFSNVWFRYNIESPWVLKGISFDLKPGEHLGVIGRTGSGKSTLLSALLMIYPLDKGFISIDGKIPSIFQSGNSEFSLDLYRSYFSLIPQVPPIFNGSLRANLSASTKTSDERLLELLEILGLGEWLRKIGSSPLEYQISEGGSNLSAGQKQLISLARSVIQDRPILVMDEATSNIDPQSEARIISATKEILANKTQLIVAHRLATIEDCHKVIWINKGEIVYYGTVDYVLTRYKE